MFSHISFASLTIFAEAIFVVCVYNMIYIYTYPLYTHIYMPTYKLNTIIFIDTEKTYCIFLLDYHMLHVKIAI